MVDAVNASLADAQQPYDVVHRVVRPDGSVRTVHEYGEIYRDQSGKWGTTGSLLVDSASNDITFVSPFPTACYVALACAAGNAVASETSASGPMAATAPTWCWPIQAAWR